MSEEPEIDLSVHRRLAARFFNETWGLLDKPDRTAEDDSSITHDVSAPKAVEAAAARGVQMAAGAAGFRESGTSGLQRRSYRRCSLEL